ncbi:MAG: ComEC/Rec2 family competence protein, partial [Cyanobacteria bacterium]|nr:ComEC/Rec2 family competence protein [Cyanobacteriota bacterium]MDW8199635.1 ComEC/Rec2 family competence protein [Cyanobacteriota bacterium SKYGB_h_bin112]
LLAFGVVSPNSIPINVVTTPLIVIVSLGAFISAVAGLVVPIVGSALAWALYWPSHWLMQIVQLTLQLPGNGIATGRITLWQLLMLYGLLCLVWWQSSYEHQPQTVNYRRLFRLPMAALLGIAIVLGCSLVMLPAWYTAAQLVRATVMATPNESVLVWQERGKVGIIGDPSPKTVDFAVVPFLQAQGINRLHWALALNPMAATSGWSAIAARFPIASLYHASSLASIPNIPALQQISWHSLTTTNPVQLGSITIRPVITEPLVLTLQLGSTLWLWLGGLSHAQQVQLATANNLPTAQVVWWSGDALAGALLKRVQPKWAIATAPQLHPDTRDRLRKRHIQLFWLTRDGAIQWKPTGFTLSSTEAESQL